jgi:hypothetical protein
VGGESHVDEHAVGVRPEGSETVGYALLAAAASAAGALTGEPRLVGGCRMRGPSVVSLVLDRVVGGEGAWLTP